MPEQALYLKYRPLRFDDVIGQEHITRTLRRSLKSGRIRHAYLFSGPRGTGKTTTARLLAKAVNCTHPDADERPCNECDQCLAVNEGRHLDLIEIDAATHTGVDDVRDLREKIAFTPGEGRYKVYIIDEVHRFSGSAFDALLKTLEEPPDHAIFVLATTEIDRVPQTIKSRCLQFEFRRVSLDEVTQRLSDIAQNEGLNIERQALEIIARQGTGSVRDSISLLDQIVSDPEEVITVDVAQRILGTADNLAVKDLVATIISEDLARGMRLLNDAVDAGSDPHQFGSQVVDHLRAVLMAQTASVDLVEASTEDRKLYETQAQQIERRRLLRAVRAFNDAVRDWRGGWQPQLALELALIDSMRSAEPEVIVQQVAASASAPTQAAEVQGGAPLQQVVPEPDSPPVISPRRVQDRWDDMLTALGRRNRGAPAVLQHYRVHHVDGNVLTIATDNEVFYKRLRGYPEKLAVVEKALWEVHQVGLHLNVIWVESLEGIEHKPAAADDVADPLLRYSIEELGAEVTSHEGEAAPRKRKPKKNDPSDP